MQQQQDGPPGLAGFQHVHGQAVDALDAAGADARGQGRV
jgi:hypothetical protein